MPLVKLLIKHAVLFYVVASISIAIFMGFATKIQNQYWLTHDGLPTHGFVVEPKCLRHLAFSYQFKVDGATYRGSSVSDQCNKIKSGDAVLVYFLYGNPRVNTAANPKRTLVSLIDMILMASLAGPAVLLLIFWLGLRGEPEKAGDELAKRKKWSFFRS
jgi:hypothetical protein